MPPVSVRVPGDPVPAIKQRMVDTFGAAVRVADELPADWNAYTATVPVLVVDDDGGPTMMPVYSHPTIRVTIYARGKQTARLLRRTAIGGLMGAAIPGIYLPQSRNDYGIGYTEARDDDTGADVATFTVTLTVPTEVITV